MYLSLIWRKKMLILYDFFQALKKYVFIDIPERRNNNN